MTCTHVLGLIDAGPLADYPPSHLDAAWGHAHQCATCGVALEAATALTSALAALPQPAPPPDLRSTVLTRIAKIDRARSALGAAATADVMVRATRRERFGWAAALGSVVAGLAIFLSVLPGAESPIDGAFLRDSGPRGLSAMPSTAREAFILAAGLLLYVGGLFAPLTGKNRQGGKKGTSLIPNP